MKRIHVKSACCGAKVQRNSGSRRRCSACGKTWRIRPKKRGRKQVRVHANINTTVIARGESIRKKAVRTGKSKSTLARRHATNLSELLRTLPEPKAPKGDLIAVVDGMIVTLQGKRHTVYLILLRPLTDTRATLMEPLILKGHETTAGWRQALLTLEPECQKRIKALVSDGHTGLKLIVREYGWVHQRCHFHLLKDIQSVRGKRWGRVTHKELREKMYQLIVQALREKSEKKAYTLVTQLHTYATLPECPPWFGRKARNFIRECVAFRAYRHYPKLNLPTTSNVAESSVRLLADIITNARGFSSKPALECWLKVKVRSMPPLTCNGEKIQPN